MRMLAVLSAALLASFAVASPPRSSRAPTPGRQGRPNVVIILADDLGWGSLGCYGADAALVTTPHCDRLAREGRRFTDANAPSSVCTPTRYALLTGRYCWRSPLQRDILRYDEPLLIDVGRLTIASLLKRHGYRTAAVGKWHLGYGSKPRLDYTGELSPGPLEIGFDYHFGVPATHGDVTGIFVEDHRVAGLRPGPRQAPVAGHPRRGREYLGLNAPDRREDQVMKVLTDKAVAWLEQQDPSRPFFLYFTPVAVHSPVTPSAERKGSSKAGSFGDWIRELDDSVGRVLEVLDRRKLAQDTLVVFTSDNGGVIKPGTPEGEAVRLGLAVNGRWRGRKHTIFEGGFRVPFLARWPGRIPAGGVSAEMVSLTDLLATIAAIVGERLPPPSQAAEDSHDILPALVGSQRTRPLRESMILHSADGVFAIRQGPWKWIEGRPHPDIDPEAKKIRTAEYAPQLYNLREDPEEKTNLLRRYPEQARHLAAHLQKHRDQGFTRLSAPAPAAPAR
jgi:arylsulfatase A-like enzyme